MEIARQVGEEFLLSKLLAKLTAKWQTALSMLLVMAVTLEYLGYPCRVKIHQSRYSLGTLLLA